jgi:hypothetical protein
VSCGKNMCETDDNRTRTDRCLSLYGKIFSHRAGASHHVYCVWVDKKEDMFFNASEYLHLPAGGFDTKQDIDRKKLYHQMLVHIQEGQVQKSVRHELPICIEIGTPHQLFPPPIFMGFRSR